MEAIFYESLLDVIDVFQESNTRLIRLVLGSATPEFIEPTFQQNTGPLNIYLESKAVVRSRRQAI
jgi:hypothetical protein